MNLNTSVVASSTSASWIPIENGLPEYDYRNSENNNYAVKLRDGSFAEATLVEYTNSNGMHIRFFDCDVPEDIVEYQLFTEN